MKQRTSVEMGFAKFGGMAMTSVRSWRVDSKLWESLSKKPQIRGVIS